jgi:hypothetical protein
MTEAIIEVGPANRGPQIKAKLAEYGQQAADLILQNGLLLREYQSGGYYKEDGHKNFDEAIEAMKNAGLLDYGARQARHFIAINIGAEEVKRLGMSKLREIASVKDTKDQLALLGSASQRSVAEIQKEAKQLRDKAAGRDTDPLDPVTLMMTETQKEFYAECIERGRLISGLDPGKVPDVVVLVDVILADWLSGAPTHRITAGPADDGSATLSEGGGVE